MSNNVVAHFLDGRIVKGTSLDVDPAKPVCHIRTPARETVPVALAELKALFFVKSLEGDRTHKDASKPAPGDIRLRGVHQIELLFADGEKMVGLTHHFPPTRTFFFVLPIDPQTNAIRCLVNRAAVTRISIVPQAA